MTKIGALASRFSLRARLTFLACATAALVLTAGALLLYGGLRDAIDDGVTAELRVRADDVAAELQAGAPLPEGGGLLTQVIAADGTVVEPAGADAVASTAEVREASSRVVVVDRAVQGIADEARLLVRSVRLEDGRRGAVAVAGSTAIIDRAEERLVAVVGIAGPAMVVAVGLMAWFLTGAALRPVAWMTDRAATLSLRDPGARLPEPDGRDEIAHLAQTLNAMLARIADTLAHERAFVDDASHELRSPLAVLRGELELARIELDGHGDPERTREVLDSALEETERLVTLTERLLVLARADAGKLVADPVPVRLADVIDEVAGRTPASAVRLDVDVDAVAVLGDPVALEQLLANLVANATRWARHLVAVRARTEGADVVLTVEDDGPGFDPTVLGRVFERFSQTDPARSRSGGTGLGLAIVAAIAHALDGRVVARNGGSLGGAVVEVWLPQPAPSIIDR